jgi:ATP-dependent Clp protease protease subunit
MIHQVSSSQSGTLADLEIELEQTRRCKNDVYKILADNTGRSFEEMEKLCDRNNWFIGQEAVDLGIVDKVLITTKKEK